MLRLKKTGLLAILLSLCCRGVSAEDIKLYKDRIIMNDEAVILKNTPFTIGNTVYIDAKDIFETEKVMSLDAFSVMAKGKQSIIFSDSLEHIVGYSMYSYKQPTFYINQNEYIPLPLAEDILGEEILVLEDIETLKGAEPFGDARYTTKNVLDAGNCLVLNREYMFQPVFIHDRQATAYADIINCIKQALPKVNVYSMLVPDSSEIYAPKEFYTAQMRSFDMINQNLSPDVSKVEAAKALFLHSDEKIYFSTDHHWTHKGAFYAWCEFAKLKGFDIPDLDDFENIPYDSFQGSYIQRLGNGYKAKDILDIPKETIDRFMPLYDTSVALYSSGDMEKLIGKVALINTKNNTYSSFISGDHPLAVIKSSVNNGKKLAIIKDSFGNAFATWAVNNYEYIYVIDVRGFAGGKLSISDFYSKTEFDDLIIESYPTTIESKQLSGYLSEMAD